MKWITFLFALFILAVIVLADLGILPHFLSIVYDFPNGDKVGHFILFGLLGFLLTFTFTRSLPNRTRALVALSIGLILMLLIALEEISQMFVSTRTFDLIDLLASYVGVVLGGFIALKIKEKKVVSTPWL